MRQHSERIWKGLAGGVHTFTALGAPCALLALWAADSGRFELAFFWLGIAFVIDGIDGTFARAVNVKERLPRFSGEQLDLVVDYTTYVFVPACILLKTGQLAGMTGLGLAALMLLTSLFHFADTESKSDDHCFVGFPAIWNIVVFYVVAFGLGQVFTAVLVVVCAALTFVPMRWLHPMRLERHRGLHMAGTVLWLAAAAWTLWHGFPASPLTQVVLGGLGIYGVGLALTMPLARPGKDGL